MARPASISNQQILDAARATFFAHGLTKASTVEIARRAGVSEGSIFNRFPTKRMLFRAAMDEAQPPALALNGLVGRGDLRKNLEHIAVASVHFLGQLLPKLMLCWSAHQLGRGRTIRARPLEILHALTDFFQEEKARGRVAGDPELAARIFMGSVWNYCFLETVAGDRSMSVPTFARRLVAVLWQGIAPARRRR